MFGVTGESYRQESSAWPDTATVYVEEKMFACNLDGMALNISGFSLPSIVWNYKCVPLVLMFVFFL